MAAAGVGDLPFAHLFPGLLSACFLAASMTVSPWVSTTAYAVAGREEIAVSCPSGINGERDVTRVTDGVVAGRDKRHGSGESMERGRVDGSVVDVAGAEQRRGCPRQRRWCVGETRDVVR